MINCKGFGYIVDYKDLFKKVENAIAVYTSELDHSAGGADPEVPVQDRLKKGNERLNNTLETLALLCEPVEPPRASWSTCNYGGTIVHTIILGAGALGSVISAYLTRAGEEVTLLARGSRAALLQEHGVAVTGVEDFTAPVAVTTRPHDLRAADVLIVTVKTYDTEPALESVSHLDIGSVFSLQNGVLKNEQLAYYFGWEKTLGASPLFSAQVTPAGPVHFTYHGGMVLGEFSGAMSSRVQTIVAMLEHGGMRPVIAPQIQAVEWSKYVSFVGWMAVAALTRLETHKFLKDPALATLVAQLIRETAQLAAHQGIPLEDHEPFLSQTLSSVPFAEAVERLQGLGRRLETQSSTHKVSTLQDLERGRRLEVEEILGYAVQRGAALGIPLPTVETCYRLLAGVNRYLQ